MSDLVKRLRIKAGMIEMGELIEWGSDSALMREAADALEMAAPAVQGDPVGYVSQDFLDGKWTLDHIAKSDEGQISRTIPVYAAPQPAEQQPAPDAALVEPVAFCEDAALSIAERTFSTEVDEQLASDIIQYAQRLHSLYTTPQPAESEILGSYPVSGQIFFRGSSNEWVLELTGSVNGATFTARHTQPADTRPEDVAGLPALYETAPDVEGLVEALERAHMALIGYLPGHRNDITDAAISHCEQALAAHRKGAEL